MSSHLAAETHVSWVFFAGDRAYKLYKPGQTDVLDARTLADRARLCAREVAVNRRFSPDVYLGAADIRLDDEIVEHVVVMRRMDPAERLSCVLEGSRRLDAVRAVARRIAVIHAQAPVLTGAMAEAVAAPEAMAARMHADVEGLRAAAGDHLDRTLTDRIDLLADRFLGGRGPLLEQRITDGHVIDGHGDLLAEDIFLTADGPQVLDALAFDDRLRHGDVLADLAFLVMDLQHLGHDDAARELLWWYGAFSNEHHPGTLAHHHVAQRAVVRAKVGALRARQRGDDDWAAVRELTRLALDHLERAQVRLVLVGGVPGTGKSTVAAGIADRLGWVHLSSDEERRDRSSGGSAEYDLASRSEVYEGLLDHARRLVASGTSVVLDATWSTAEWRDAARRLAAEASSAVHEVRCVAPTDLARRRVDQRPPSLSDATPQVVDELFDRFADWPEALEIATTGTVEATVDQVLVGLPTLAWTA